MRTSKIIELVVAMASVAMASDARAAALGTATIDVRRLSVDVDARPDVPGLQYTSTAVKDVSTGVIALVIGSDDLAAMWPATETSVAAELVGPVFPEPVSLYAPPNSLMSFPRIVAPGTYYVRNVRLEDTGGHVLLARDPTLPVVTVEVISEILATQVTSRPLTAAEIQEKGILITDDNFTAVNFTIGLTMGSEHVVVDLPVVLPSTGVTYEPPRQPSFGEIAWKEPAFQVAGVPNFSVVGFAVRPPPELEEVGIQIPPINGVIIIPGNIGFLNQFFSVIVATTNLGPDGSGLEVRNARARIVLPPGPDAVAGSGDDPLRAAKTQEYPNGVPAELPLLDAMGQSVIPPQGTNQAEYLVEGLREGTHRLRFDILGDLFVPALGHTVPITGNAAGVVQVKNPTFSVVLAHPDVVREGEEYSIFATVTNTSSSPANLFSLNLNTRSLSGARLADGAPSTHSLDSLLPGAAESFEFRLVAQTTGEVTGTVFLADDRVNGQFLLTTGVGDTGIPLSPDTLVLPQTVENIPDDPDLVHAAVRLLGQAYSVATAPAGTLPPTITRIGKSYVFDRAVKLAQVGLHARFGESRTAGALDLMFDYFGSKVTLLDEIYLGPIADLDPNDDDPEVQRRIATAIEARDAALRDMTGFDGLRRQAAAGHNFSRVLGEIVRQASAATSLSQVQLEAAALFASKPDHISYGATGPVSPAGLSITDANGRLLGVGPDGNLDYELPFAGLLPLGTGSEQIGDLAFVVAADAAYYDLDFVVSPWAQGGTISLVMPTAAGLGHFRFELDNAVPAGTRGHLRWLPNQAPEVFVFELDTDGDGLADGQLVPTVTLVPDRPPQVLGVHQWGKGTTLDQKMTFDTGDPLGRLVAVLFDEEVTGEEAEALASYTIPEHRAVSVHLQGDNRVAFVMFDRPVGPFVARELTVQGVRDLRELVMTTQAAAVVPDPELGIGGVVEGVVRAPDGTPVPFAAIRYLQLVDCAECLFQEEWPRDLVISDFVADMDGHYRLDYVLQNTTDSGGGEPLPLFRLLATDPLTGHPGRVATQIRYDGQRMRLDIIIRGYGSIVGHLLDEEGNPVAGGDPGSASSLAVHAQNVSTGESALSWVDAEGYFAFPRSFPTASGGEISAPQLPVGNVVLRVVRAADAATAVSTANIPAAGAVVTHDLFLTPSIRYGSVRGRVVDADGTTGAAYVDVAIKAPLLTKLDLYQREYKQLVVGVVQTDAAGRFEFHDVPTGDVEVIAFRQSTYEKAVAKSYLAEGESKSLTLMFPGTGGAVRGIVVDALGARVAGATVAAGPTIMTADEFGYFEMPAMPLGTFNVSAQAPDTQGTGSVKVTIGSPGTVVEVVIRIEPMGTIVGTLRNANGGIVVGQEVQAWTIRNGMNGIIGITYTNTLGRYEFKNYPIGHYTIIAVTGDYGDGGKTEADIRYAGDLRNADVQFRGLGRVKGRVVQSNGTPVIADLLLTRMVWRVVTQKQENNYYLDYVEQLSQIEGIGEDVLAAFRSGYGADHMRWFIGPQNEPTNTNGDKRPLRSDVLGPNGEVTGEFEFTGSITGGPFTVTAGSGFLSPATVRGEIPKTTNPAGRVVDVGTIVLEESTGSVAGTVYLPDGVTPVGEGVAVRIKSLGSATPTTGMLPEFTVTTASDGTYDAPLVAAGNVRITGDTLSPQQPALTAAQMDTDTFAGLNVRLYGVVGATVPRGRMVQADIRLHDVVGLRVHVVESDGSTPVAGARVTIATTSTLDAELDRTSVVAGIPGYVNQTADSLGFLDVFPVIEGSFSINAAHPTTAARGRVDGVVPIDPVDGTVLPITVRLDAITTAGGQVVPVASFGTVTGTVQRADGTTLVNPAEVAVLAGGARIATTSDENGRFGVEYVPAGGFKVEVFEPLTARTGSTTGRVTANTVTDVTIKLVGLGTVSGQVYAASGLETIGAAQVVLHPSGNFSAALITTADLDGSFSFPGVPLGPYQIVATDYVSGLIGSASGTMAADGDANTTDVYLPPSGSISGVVYGSGVVVIGGSPKHPDGSDWTDAPRVEGARVTLKNGKFVRSVTTDAGGMFDSGLYLPLGTYSITARPQNGADGGTASVALTYDGEHASVALALRGRGVVSGVVLDSLGEEPIAAAQITLKSQSPFASPSPLSALSASCTGGEPGCRIGSFSFADVSVGAFSITVRTTLQTPQLGASVSGSVAVSGVVVAFCENTGGAVIECPADATQRLPAIRLQASGDLLGTVLLSDGTSPAAGAAVTIDGPGDPITHSAASDGTFAFESLPLGSYAVSILEPETNGIARRSATLASNGQVLDLGAVVLDDAPPAIVATSPALDATDVDTGTASAPTPIVVVFNERMKSSTINATTMKVTRGATILAGTYTVADDPGVSPPRTRVTFTPAQRFADVSTIRMEIKGEKRGFEGQLLDIGPTDLVGFGLPATYVLTFVTADTTPPSIVSRSPAPGAREVAAESVVRIEFSEPIRRDRVGSFTLSRNGVPVAGTVAWPAAFGDRVVIFAPGSFLLPNGQYVVQIDGQIADAAGNTMAAAPISWSFFSTDTDAPLITGVEYPPTATREAGTSLTLTAIAGATDVARVEFAIDGAAVGADTTAPYEYTLQLTQSMIPAVRFGAVAVDVVGNRGPLFEAAVPVVPNAIPVATIVSPADGSTLNEGATVTVRVRAEDATGLTKISYVAGGGGAGSGSMNITGKPSTYTTNFILTLPQRVPHGTTVSLRGSATDVLGASGGSPPVDITVRDVTAPSVNITAPPANSVLEPGQRVAVSVRAEDVSSIRRVHLYASGRVTSSQIADISPPASPAVATFYLDVPDRPLGGNISLDARAEDVAGNTGFKTLSVQMRDRPAQIVSIVPADGAVAVSAVERVRIDFSEKVSGVSTATVRVLDPQGIAVPGHIQIDDSAAFTRAYWEPDAVYEPGAQHTLVLDGPIADVGGNRVQPTTSRFTVTDLVLAQPQEGARYVEGQSIQFQVTGANLQGLYRVDYFAGDALVAWDDEPPFESGGVPAPAVYPPAGAAFEAVQIRATLAFGSGRYLDVGGGYIDIYPASGDADGDGIANGDEIRAGTDPFVNDAGADPDGDGLYNSIEAMLGTDIHNPDTDGDTLTDGTEDADHDGIVDPDETNPLLPDTDGDGVRDALERQTNSDPRDPDSLNLSQALSGIEVEPARLDLVRVNARATLDQRLAVTGLLRDGWTLDLTSTSRGTTYTSSDIAVCTLGAPDGRIRAGTYGECTITVENAGHSAVIPAAVRPFNPTVRSFMDIEGDVAAVDVEDGFAYVATHLLDGSWKILAIDVRDPDHPVEVSRLEVPSVVEIDAVGSIVYVAAGSYGLRILDFSNLSTPSEIGSYEYFYSAAYAVRVRESVAYVGVNGGLSLLDVRQPSAPIQLGYLDTGSGVTAIDVSDDLHYAMIGHSYYAGRWVRQFEVVDVLDPRTPVVVGGRTTTETLEHLHLKDYLAFGAYRSGNKTDSFDISDPTAPAVHQVGGSSKDVAWSWDVLLLATGETVDFVDIADPTAAAQVRTLDLPVLEPWLGYCQSMAIDAYHAYLGCYAGARPTGGLYIVQYRDADTDGDGAADGVERLCGKDPAIPDVDADDMLIAGNTITASSPLALDELCLAGGTTLASAAATGTTELRLEITARSITIAADSTIEVSEKGYLGGGVAENLDSTGRTLGNTAGCPIGSYAAGGSYGGEGSFCETEALVYGDYQRPNELGSGGGAGIGGQGGSGGGFVRLQADTIVIDGAVWADGGNAIDGGGGSGGGIDIVARVFRGNGILSASGGASQNHGAGGGGRIAVKVEDEYSFSGSIAAAGTTGKYSSSSGAGTIFVRRPGDSSGTLLVENSGGLYRPARTPLRSCGPVSIASVAAHSIEVAEPIFPTPDSPVGAIGLRGVFVQPDATQPTMLFRIVDNTATTLATDPADGDMTMVAAPGDVLLCAHKLDGLWIYEKASLEAGAIVVGGAAYPWVEIYDSYANIGRTHFGTGVSVDVRNSDLYAEVISSENLSLVMSYLEPIGTTLHIRVPGTLSVDAASTIDATAVGYPGGGMEYEEILNGYTRGGIEFANASPAGSTGGSHAGLGGRGAGGLDPNSTYGDFSDPRFAGTGGGAASIGSEWGGAGGGIVEIVAGVLVLDGEVLADGDAGYEDAAAGSGGSVRFEVGTLRGAGTARITARGGAIDDPATNGSGAGGGGRIAVVYGDMSEFGGTFSAAGGTGSTPAASGGAGTVFLKPASGGSGSLIVDNEGIATTCPSTVIAGVGAGTLTAVEGDDLIDAAACFPLDDDMPAMLVNPNTLQSLVFEVASNTADRLTTLPAGATSVSQVASAGDGYVGVYRLGSISVLGGACVSTPNDLLVEGAITVDAASSLDAHNASY